MSEDLHIKIQITGSKVESIKLNKGDSLFILGANGSGKSSLIYNIIKGIDIDKTVLVSAHRQVWFDSPVIDMSNQDYAQTLEFLTNNIKYSNESRWKINDSRINKLPLIRLRKSVNRRNKFVAEKFDQGIIDEASQVPPSPLKVINEILHSSGMLISIEHNEEDNISAVNHRYSPPSRYSISELSDGEKNAISISSDIVSAFPGSIIIIDEPERHLHKSISASLLSELISLRPDCFFIISTHDINLASDMDSSQILLVRSCTYSSNIPVAWDVNLITSPQLIPDEIRKDILGAKKRVLFIEGDSTSLDMGLYQNIFPDTYVVPKSGCEEVLTSVSGIRENESINWVNAFGLVDNDNKTQSEIDDIRSCGVFTLKYHSIESIFYHPKMIEFFIREYGSIFEVNSDVLKVIRDEVIEVFSHEAKRDDLCRLAVNKRVRWKFNESIPSHKYGFTNQSITINAGDIYEEELSVYNKAIESRDVITLFERYSIRRTGVLNKIVKRLNCSNRNLYESKIISIVRDNEDVRDFVVGCLGGVVEEMNHVCQGT